MKLVSARCIAEPEATSHFAKNRNGPLASRSAARFDPHSVHARVKNGPPADFGRP